MSGSLAVLAVAVTLRVGARLPAPAGLAGWLGLESGAYALLVRPVLAAAHALARFDDRVLDRGVEALAEGARGAARLLDRFGEPSLDGVVGALATGARALGRLARRPQTGQIHQYFAQGAAVLAVVAVVVAVLG